MSFTDAVKSVYRNYAKFDGRAQRSEYWWFVLFTALVSLGLFLVGGLVYSVARTSTVFTVVTIALIIFLIVSFIPSLAVAVRRLHDTGRSGWWYLIVFIPYIGAIVLLVLLAMPSSPGYNHFGPPPGMSSVAQPAQYWGPGRPEALRKFAEDSQLAAASGYYPMWQEWKLGPAGEFLEVVYDRVPAQQAWGHPGNWPPGPGPFAAGGSPSQGPGPYQTPGGTYQTPGGPYQSPGPYQAPNAYRVESPSYQGGPPPQPMAGSPTEQPALGEQTTREVKEPAEGEPPAGPSQPPRWS